MRIESFWAKGFRSLRDVRLDKLGAFNVFYGPNGAGKSNLLAAIQALLEICQRDLHLHPPGQVCNEGLTAVLGSGVIQPRDLYARDDSRTIVLGAHFVNGEDGSRLLASGPLKLPDLTIEFTLDWILPTRPKLMRTRLESDGQDLRTSLSPENGPHLQALLAALPARAYTLIHADRFPRAEHGGFVEDAHSFEPFKPPHVELSDDIASYLRSGQLKRALLAAQIGPSSVTRRRLDELRKLLGGPPLNRPPFVSVQDKASVELRERLAEPNPEGLEIPIDLAGLGIAQIYMILAQAMLSGARTVGIEEPEAHLHAPTSGVALHELLKRLVDEKYVDQLFIATHHHQFALAEEYLEVSLDAEGSTQVKPRPRDEAVKHFYEPSPYWDTLRKLVGEGMSPDTILLLDREGQPIRAKEVLASIEGDRRIADQFVEAATKAFVLSLAKDEPEK
jgi:hypothetical protein